MVTQQTFKYKLYIYIKCGFQIQNIMYIESGFGLPSSYFLLQEQTTTNGPDRRMDMINKSLKCTYSFNSITLCFSISKVLKVGINSLW